MKLRQKIAAYGLALLSLIGTLTLVAPQSAVAGGFNTCDLSKKIDELRAWDTNNKYNFLVWKESAKESIRLNGVSATGSEHAQDCSGSGDWHNYYWAIFRDGEFTRKGDGGYRNWAFFGRWNRDNDRHVTFLLR